MQLDLRELIKRPDGVVPFSFELDMSDYDFDSVKEFRTPVSCVGQVENHAGTLTLTAALTAELLCVCARCLKEFPKRLQLDVTAYLAEELEDEDSVDYYLLKDGMADLDEIMVTTVVLNMEQRFLCREDCKGLCAKCGKDLNDGPCGCGEDKDSRWAVLGQLLEKE